MIQADTASLDYKGRERPDNWGYRGAARHQQYFTPKEVAQAIYRGLASVLLQNADEEGDRKLNVLDPTCGSGRLLYPWKHDKRCRVLGIELDADAAEHARHLLGDASVRVGDILAYPSYLNNRFGLVVINPPYELWWEKTEHFETSGYEKVRSENACMEIAVRALNLFGLCVAILPTSCFEKEKKLAAWLAQKCHFLARLTVKDLFKPEYGIDVSADVLLLKIKTGYGRQPGPCYRASFDYSPGRLEDEWLLACQQHASELTSGGWNIVGEPVVVPHLSRLLPPVATDATVEINADSVSPAPVAAAMLDFTDATFPTYNPGAGRYTGLVEATLSRPALTLRGVEPAVALCRELGMEPKLARGAAEKLARLQKRYRLLSIPLRAPKFHQRLAWFEPRDYRAKATVKHAGQTWFVKGREYRFRPSWRRQRSVVRIDAITDSKGRQTGEIRTEVDRGFLVLAVETKFGAYHFEEQNAADVELLLSAFDLPDVPELETAKPELVAGYRAKLESLGHFSGEFDYQLEDVARLCVKPFGYLGWEQGGGKSMAAAAWAWARGYKRVLVVCQSSLIKNWENELDKFGFRSVKVLRGHQDIDELQARKRGEIALRRVVLGALDKELVRETEFYIISYEFLSLDTKKVFDPWDCRKYRFDKKLQREIIVHEVKGITGEHCPECGCDHAEIVVACPQCQAQASEGWSTQVCARCGHRAYSYQAAAGRQYPAYKRLRKLFSAVMLDEAQMAKSKLSDRGRACRALRSRGKLVLTGTIMRGYVWDTYFNISWLLGFNNPLFPYPRIGGERLFLKEFATEQWQFSSKGFQDTLQKGKKKKVLPEVSNLNRFWRLLASFTLRRRKEEMVKLPEKHRYPVFLAMDAKQSAFYQALDAEASDAIKKALRLGGESVNMGLISTWLWRLRFASTVPTTPVHLPLPLLAETWNKLEAVIALAHAFRDNGQKGVIYTGLPEFGAAVAGRLQQEKLNVLHITAQTPTRKRFDLIRRFTRENYWDCIVSGLNVLNRGFTIVAPPSNGAVYKPICNVVITDLDYSPEPMVQAEDRVHRTGQQHPVNVFYLLNAGTIDQTMLEKVTQKQAAIEQAIDGRSLHADTASVLARLAESEGIQLQIARAIAASEPFNMTRLKADKVEEVIKRVFGQVKEHQRNRETVQLVDVDLAAPSRRHKISEFPIHSADDLMQLALWG